MSKKNAGRGKPTGAGAEAAEGIHAADRPKDESQRTSAPKPDQQADGDDRRGSEPTTSHSSEHQSSYGGGGVNGGAEGGKK